MTMTMTMLLFGAFFLFVFKILLINGYPTTSFDDNKPTKWSDLAAMPSSQINNLCKYITRLTDDTDDTKTNSKRFVVPFPDMNRFLSTNHKLHHHHTAHTEKGHKHDHHAYLCSISKDSEEITNFINVFTEENGEAPTFNIFESCEQVSKRNGNPTTEEEESKSSSSSQLEELAQFCSEHSKVINKRWVGKSLDGPISIDFINQMLEARKVKAYPYEYGRDPYVLGR